MPPHLLRSPYVVARRPAIQSQGLSSLLSLRSILLTLLVVLVCSLFYIWSRTQIFNLGYEITRANKVKEEITEQNKKLLSQVATLKSIVRLEELAKTQFDMDLPQKSQLFNTLPHKVLVAQTEEKLPPKNEKQKEIKKLPQSVASANTKTKLNSVKQTEKTQVLKNKKISEVKKKPAVIASEKVAPIKKNGISKVASNDLRLHPSH